MNIANPAVAGVFFDPHANVKKLREAGLTEKQAEVHTEILSKLVNDDLAAKQDLQKLQAHIELKMKEQESRLLTEIHKIKAETVKWMLTISLAQGGLIVALLKLL